MEKKIGRYTKRKKKKLKRGQALKPEARIIGMLKVLDRNLKQLSLTC